MKKITFLLFFVVVFLFNHSIFSQVTMSPNDMVVLQVTTDGGSDEVAFLVLEEISAGSKLFFSDISWNALASTQGTDTERGIRLTVGASAITAGTIIRIKNDTGQLYELEVPSQGTLEFYELDGSVETGTSRELTLSTSGDQLIIFQTSDGVVTSTRTFIYALSLYAPLANDLDLDGWTDSGSALGSASSDSHVPTGLTALNSTQSNKTTASAMSLGGLSGHLDNWIYTGVTTSASKNEWLTRIHTLSNWNGTDDTPPGPYLGITYDNVALAGNASSVTVSSGDTTPPVFENSTPSQSSVAQTTFTLETDIDEAGNIYYVVVPDGDGAPSSTQVKAGQNSAGGSPVTSGNATVNSGGFTNDFSVVSISASTAYDVYVVAEDDEGSPNLQASPTKIDVTTLSPTWDGSTDSDWNTASNWDINAVPATTANVTIPSGLTNYPTASGAITVNSVSMASGSSLIAQSTFSGTITYNRTIGTTNWYLISSPVVGQDIDAFEDVEGLATGTTANNVGLGDYSNSTPGWVYYQSGAVGTGNFVSGDGRSLKLASTGDIAFTGTLNVNDAGVGIGITSNTNGFNLIGNPYPSYIAANNTADATNNILKVNDTDNDFLTESTIWFWNQATSSYDQRNHATGSFFIAPGQGFFVSSNGSNTFSFTEAMQSHQTDSFQRSSSTNPEIQLIMTDGSKTRNSDIYYLDGTTTGFDNGYDSSIFEGVANSFSLFTEAVANGTGKKLGIQSLPNSDYENMIIPVGVISSPGLLSFSATTTNLPSGHKVYLEDKETELFTRLDEINSKYEVTLNTSLNGIGRFFLHTTTSTLSLNPENITNISIYISSRNNLRVVGIQEGTTQLRMFNILGKQVLKTSFQSNGVDNIGLPNLRHGVYIIQISSKEGLVNKKIIIE